MVEINLVSGRRKATRVGNTLNTIVMKKFLLFIAAGLMMTTAQAINQTTDGPIKGYSKRYNKVQPVLFTYDNIDFAMYPDGQLEFELPRYATNQRYARRATDRRRSPFIGDDVR